VGIEIARRIGRPAVTFSPTTTIQQQWREKVRLFLPEDEEGERRLRAGVSTDPADLAALSCLTYQSLSTQTQAHEFLDRIGRAAWADELVAGGRTPEGAEAYLDDLATKVPDEVERGIASRASRRKRELLASGQASLADLLHPNALALVDRLVAAGTGCIVLDEAHHLLDYWAAILAHLVERLPEAVVVGLTATPPASAGPDELENYLALVDGIDFEVPTPAVVRSGHLAPYQDLVQVVEPTADERRFLEHEDRVLEEAMAGVFADPRFAGHVEARINRANGTPTWDELVSEEFELAVAGVRYLTEAGRTLAPDVQAPPEMLGPLQPRDRLALVRDWCLGFLRVSPDARDRAALADLRQALRTLGMVMTDAGWRPAPSPLDRILAYSSAKVEAMVAILRTEQASMGERVRAVVLTDFETSSALSLRRLRGVLDPESGGAVRAIRAIVDDPEAGHLEPIMVTGRTVLADADLAGRLATELTARFEREGVRATVRTEDAGHGLVAVDGAGPDWAPRAWVPAVTELFERGVTRCIVGTRGLLSEGWDSLTLNTLVDLTTAGTYASVNQIRGRSIRLDPNDPHKVANNWDLVCVASDLRGGWRDLERLAAKHGHVWGLGPEGRVVRGIGHVDPRLVLLPANPVAAALSGVAHVSAADINRRAVDRARHRSDAYEEWGVGKPYENFEFRGTILDPSRASIRTAFTWGRSLKALLNLIVANLLLYLTAFGYALPRFLDAGVSLAWLVVAVGGFLIITIGVSIRLGLRYVRAAFIELPVDSYLLDFGRAVAEALRETRLAPASPDRVRVTETETASYEVHLDTSDQEASDRFADAYRELFEPITDQRYLVERDEASLSGTFYRPIWYVLRGLFRPFRRRTTVYHPVPAIFARRRELAEAFAKAWSRWVGGRRLVYTRSDEGARILLRERARGAEGVPSASVDEWR
jgi:superfamily II DNA or RNA helicase